MVSKLYCREFKMSPLYIDITPILPSKELASQLMPQGQNPETIYFVNNVRG
jgi:hypothetical protein